MSRQHGSAAQILQQRYRVIRSLGQGGRGFVLLCDDLRLPGKQWAVKRMHLTEPGQEARFRDMFVREATILSNLAHPNLPHVADFFDEDGDLYVVMEHVEGENLAEHVRRVGPLVEVEALRHGRILAEILVYLHGQAPPLVFRDLKPENVMLDADGILKLIDFGLARRLERERRNETLPSGSVGYAAPEQWEEESHVDGRADIYSWGATMIHLLTARIPSPQLPLRALESASPPVSAGLSAILRRCLQAAPEDRYPDATALLNDVRAHLRAIGVDSEVRPPAAAARPAAHRAPSAALRAPIRFASPVRAVAGPLALLLAATLVFVGALALRMRQAPAPRAAAAPSSDGAGVRPGRARGRPSAEKARGKKLYAEHRWLEAIAALDQASTLAPDDSEAHVLKENAYVRLSGHPFWTIPCIAPATGLDAAEYYPHLDGLALAQAQVNGRGGVRGRKLVVEPYDDESSTSRALRVASQIVADAAVRVVLGPTGSQRVLAVAPLFNASHVNLVSPTASSARIWESGPYVFTASDSRDPRVRVLARYCVGHGWRRVAVAFDGTSRLCKDMAATFAAELQARGGECVELPPYEENPATFQPQVDALVKSPVDMIFFADYRVPPLAHFASQLRARGVNTPLCAQTVPFARELVDEAGGAVEGLLLTDFFHPQVAAPRMQSFVEAFQRKFGDITPTYQAADSYDALQAVVAGMEVADTREGLNAFLRASGVTRPAFDGVGGRFALGRRLDERPIWIIQVTRGRFKLLREG